MKFATVSEIISLWSPAPSATRDVGGNAAQTKVNEGAARTKDQGRGGGRQAGRSENNAVIVGVNNGRGGGKQNVHDEDETAVVEIKRDKESFMAMRTARSSWPAQFQVHHQRLLRRQQLFQLQRGRLRGDRERGGEGGGLGLRLVGGDGVWRPQRSPSRGPSCEPSRCHSSATSLILSR